MYIYKLTAANKARQEKILNTMIGTEMGGMTWKDFVDYRINRIGYILKTEQERDIKKENQQRKKGKLESGQKLYKTTYNLYLPCKDVYCEIPKLVYDFFSNKENI